MDRRIEGMNGVAIGVVATRPDAPFDCEGGGRQARRPVVLRARLVHDDVPAIDLGVGMRSATVLPGGERSAAVASGR